MQFMQRWPRPLVWIDQVLESWRVPLFLILMVVLLRLPNLCEPYWYGDEGIYLTIGNALRSGSRMYADIIDHKTPLIYYFAIVPSQIWFRVFNLFWMSGTTVLFYVVAKRLLSSWPAILASLFFVFMTSVPWFEGNIPNGELFMMGFVLLGLALFTKTELGHQLWPQPPAPTKHSHPAWQLLQYTLLGIPFSLAILTKVPSLFDAVAVAGIWWFSLTRHFKLSWLKSPHQIGRYLQKAVLPAVVTGLFFVVGLLLPILLSVAYYAARGTLSAYIDFGLLYNFHYAQNWSLPFTSAVGIFLFSLPGKFLLVALVWLILTGLAKFFHLRYQFVIGWFALALFAALLSNRPYPHYFQQVMPPLALILGLLLDEGGQLLKKTTHWASSLLRGSFMLLVVAVFPVVLLVLHAGLYPTGEYYQKFWLLLTGKMSKTAYQESFNSIIRDNQRASQIIKQAQEHELFIWGTNPMLYAQSQTVPVGRFTVAFHIKDLKLEAETMQKVIQAEPRFIVVMHEDQQTLPGLQPFLDLHYMPNTSFQYFTLWKHL